MIKYKEKFRIESIRLPSWDYVNQQNPNNWLDDKPL